MKFPSLLPRRKTYNFLAYEATEGLNRINEDDSVPNWVVEEIEAHRLDEEEVPVDYEQED